MSFKKADESHAIRNAKQCFRKKNDHSQES